MSSKAKQVLLWLTVISTALLFVWYLQGKQTKALGVLTIDEAITRINNKDFKEVYFKDSQVEFTDKSDEKFTITIGSNPTMELLLSEVKAFNEANGSSKIKWEEDKPMSEWGWLVLIQILPFLLIFGFLAFLFLQLIQ